MQSGANILVVQHSPKPVNLVWGLKKWMRTKNVGMLPVNENLDFPDRFGSHIFDAFDMLASEQQMIGVDMACLDKAFGFTTGLLRLNQNDCSECLGDE